MMGEEGLLVPLRQVEPLAPGVSDEVSAELVHFFSSGEPAQHITDLLARHEKGPSRCAKAELVVEALDLFEQVPGSYRLLRRGFANLLSALNGALGEAGKALAAENPSNPALTLRSRLVHVPGREFARQSVSQLRVADEGQLVRILGTVTRAGPVKVVQEWRNFRCEQCGHSFGCRASPACGYDFEIPKECPGAQKKTKWDAKAKRPKTSRCHSKLFAALPASEDCMSDFQEIRVQDDMQALDVGVVPQSCAVTVFGDMVGVAQPGDSVTVEGIVYQRWRPTFPGKRIEVELFIEAVNVERLARDSSEGIVTSKSHETQEVFHRYWTDTPDEWCGRAALVAAAAPWLSGLPVPKLALLLTLIGGAAHRGEAASNSVEMDSRWGRFLDGKEVQSMPTASAEDLAEPASAPREADDATRHSRTTPHLLLLGDPGTGKSQLLQAAQELGGRSIRTSGLGCTSAGLTCAAVRDGPDWALEAGALVLADGGVCCIDEFSTIRSHDKAAIHEAMEQQTVSVAKAGMICRLHSRCSVVAAQNCRGSSGKGRGQGAAYDLSSSLAVNSGLPPPLLSRFDLVVVFAEGGKGGATESDKAEFILESTGQSSVEKPPVWDHGRLREYLMWAKDKLLDEDDEPGAALLLETYFQKLRSTSLNSGGGGGGVTARTLESLVRLAQAHAKLMGRRSVWIEDAVAVVVLHRASLQDHVVGAESLPSGEDFAPSLRDWQDETAACGVKVSLEGLELHHGTEIPNQDVYLYLEQAILRSLKLCRSSNDKRLLVPLQQAMAIADAPRPLRAREPRGEASQAKALGGSQAASASSWASQQVMPCTQETRVAQAAQAKPRGRQLGCRVR